MQQAGAQPVELRTVTADNVQFEKRYRGRCTTHTASSAAVHPTSPATATVDDGWPQQARSTHTWIHTRAVAVRWRGAPALDMVGMHPPLPITSKHPGKRRQAWKRGGGGHAKGSIRPPFHPSATHATPRRLPPAGPASIHLRGLPARPMAALAPLPAASPLLGRRVESGVATTRTAQPATHDTHHPHT